MTIRRARWTAVAATILFALTLPTVAASAARTATGGSPHADLDGKPIPVADVGKRFCHDFAYPAIHCFSTATALEANVAPALATTAASVTYVVVYEYTAYQGAYMYMSEDYQVLGTIGWNDRISSISVRNSQSGRFWTDWFYTGTSYYFCCNSQTSSLGSFDNSFSSVFHY